MIYHGLRYYEMYDWASTVAHYTEKIVKEFGNREYFNSETAELKFVLFMDSKVFFIQKQKETLGNILIRILCFLFLISGSAGAFALQPDIVKEVRGVVLDVNNEPLIGVSVMLKGTTIGTITDFDGNYTIKVKGTKPVLSFSYIGYQTQEILVGSKSRIDVVLTEELTALDEVVVVAYGSQSKVVCLARKIFKCIFEELALPILRIH